MSEDLTAPDVEVSPGADSLTLKDIDPASVARLEGNQKQRTELAGREAMLSEREGELALAREKGLAPLRQSLQDHLSQPFPDAPHMQPMPEAPSGPIIEPEKFKEFASIAFPFMLLLGKTMRADGIQALNALSSGVQGYMQGRQQEANEKFKQFQAKMQQVTQENQKKVNEYRTLLQRRDLETQQKLQLLEATAQKYDDAGMYYAAQRKSIGDIYKHLDQDDKNTTNIIGKSENLFKAIEAEQTKREHWQRVDRIAKDKVQMMGTTKRDPQTQRKLQWLQGQQIGLFKTFAEKMSALAQKQLPESQRKLAETQLRNWYAGAMKYTNDIGRAEGFTIPPELEAQEHAQNDPLGPTATPQSAAEGKSWRDGIVNAWRHMFGTPPGANPSNPAPQGPQPDNGGWSATPMQ